MPISRVIKGKKGTKAGKLIVGSEIEADIKLKNDLIFRIWLFGEYSKDVIALHKWTWLSFFLSLFSNIIKFFI